MIELFARDKTLNAYLYQIGIVEVVCFQNVVRVWENVRDENFASVWWLWSKSQSPQELDMFQPLLESIRDTYWSVKKMNMTWRLYVPKKWD